MTAVRDIMTPNPTTISQGMLASEAARIMRDADIGMLPVLRDGRLEGVITDRDLVTKALADRGDVAVGDFMTRNVITLSPDDAIERAEELMSQNGIRRLLVCDGSEIVGVVSVGDLAVQVSDSLAGEVMSETGPDDRGGSRMQASGQLGSNGLSSNGRQSSVPAAPATGLDGGVSADDILESSREDPQSLQRRDSLGGSNVRGGSDILGAADSLPNSELIGGSDALRGEMITGRDGPLAGDAEVAGSRIIARKDGIALDDEQNGEFGRG